MSDVETSLTSHGDGPVLVRCFGVTERDQRVQHRGSRGRRRRQALQQREQLRTPTALDRVTRRRAQQSEAGAALQRFCHQEFVPMTLRTDGAGEFSKTARPRVYLFDAECEVLQVCATLLR